MPDQQDNPNGQKTERAEDGRRDARDEAHPGEGRGQSGAPADDGKPKAPFWTKRRLIIGGIVLAVVVLVLLLYWLHARNFVSTDDAYTTTHVHEISARVAGTIEQVDVEDNQRVKGGELLIALDPRDFKVALEQAQGQLLQRRAASAQAEANLVHAQEDYDRVIELGKKQVVAKQDMDAAIANLKNAKGAMAGATADLAAAEAAKNNAELQLSYTKIIAPTDGIIGKKTAETGERVQPGQALMAVVEQNVWVLANFKETQLAHMRVGQHVVVHIDSIPDHDFSAHVDSLQPGTGATFALLPPDNATGNFTKIVQRVPVKIVFDNVGNYRDRVVPGLSCEPKVDLRTGRTR